MNSNSVAGFTVLTATYSPSATHVFYARRHNGPKKNKFPEARTLFLVNVPPDTTERDLILFFKPAGTIEKVVFDSDYHAVLNDDSDDLSDSDVGSNAGASDAEKKAMSIVAEPAPETLLKKRKRKRERKPKVPEVVPLPAQNIRTLRSTGQSAHVIFLDSSSLDRALTVPSKPRQWPTTSEEPSGLAHYDAQYDAMRPLLTAVREHADTAMELFEYEQARNKQKSKYRKGDAIVDEDGFTLVTRGGAYGQTVGGGVGVASKRFQKTGEASSDRSKKKEKKEKEGFYAFQKAERQRNQLLELKKNWEEDKAKIERLRETKKFKPY